MFWYIASAGVVLLSYLLLLWSFVCFFLTKNPTRITAVYFLKQKTQSQKITLVPLFIQFSAKIMPVDSKLGKFPWMEWSRRVVMSHGKFVRWRQWNLPNIVHGARAEQVLFLTFSSTSSLWLLKALCAQYTGELLRRHENHLSSG